MIAAHQTKIICFTVFLLLTFYLKGQEGDSLKFHKEAGIDAFFMNSFIPFEKNLGVSAPYLVSYRKYKRKDSYNRYGINVDIDGKIEDKQSNISRSNFGINLDLKFGKGRIKNVAKQFDFHYGWDILPKLNFSFFQTNNPNELILDKTSRNVFGIGIGGGPFIGIQYNFNERIGIYTEVAFYGKIEGNRSVTTFEDPDQDEFIDLELQINEDFILPGAVILFFKF